MKIASKILSLTCIILTLVFNSNLYAVNLTLSDLEEIAPAWVKEQIMQDFALINTPNISLDELDRFFRNNSENLYLVKFTISDNRVYTDYLFPPSEGCLYRMSHFVNALNLLSAIKPLPNVVFLLSLHDGLGEEPPVPIFVMSRINTMENLILLPDYDALQGEYQVLKKQDVVTDSFLWHRKKAQLIWRGSTAQRALNGETYWLTEDNYQIFSRVILCQLAMQYPKLLNAKFTFFAQGGDSIPYLQQFRGDFVDFEQQFKYKYHLLIDGNACPFSNSCWKFFTNSLIFKPDSHWIQWYYKALIPHVHYLPVHANLDDLVEKVQWAIHHDRDAGQIAANGRNFAVNNLTSRHSHIYLYHLLQAYSQFAFTL